MDMVHLRTYSCSHHHATFPKTGTSESDNIGTCYDSSSESCRNAHSDHIPVSFARFDGKSPAWETKQRVQQLTSDGTKLQLSNFVILLGHSVVTHTLYYLATLTGMHPIVKARGLVPADLTLHADPRPCAVFSAKTQLFWQRGWRGMRQVWKKRKNMKFDVAIWEIFSETNDCSAFISGWTR